MTPKKKNKDKKKINFSPLNQFALKNQQKIFNKDNNSNYNNILVNEINYDNNNNNTDFKKKT